MKVFFIIKHNSQRIKNKNFKKILNLKLYKKVLYKFKNFKVFVDTDSERILKIMQNRQKFETCLFLFKGQKIYRNGKK